MRFTFFRKEMRESFFTYRFWTLCGVFLFFALLNAPLARYMKVLFTLMEETGVDFTIPDPVFTDAYFQFFNNMATCLLLLVIFHMSSVPGEIKKGTAHLILSKGLSRHFFFLSKLAAAVLTYTAVYVLSSLITIGYTWLLFGSWYFDHLFLSMFAYWLFGLTVLIITLSVGAMSLSAGMAALAGLASILFLPMAGELKTVRPFLPGKMSTLAVEFLSGNAAPADMATAVSGTLLFCGFFVILGMILFRWKEI